MDKIFYKRINILTFLLTLPILVNIGNILAAFISMGITGTRGGETLFLFLYIILVVISIISLFIFRHLLTFNEDNFNIVVKLIYAWTATAVFSIMLILAAWGIIDSFEDLLGSIFFINDSLFLGSSFNLLVITSGIISIIAIGKSPKKLITIIIYCFTLLSPILLMLGLAIFRQEV